MMTASTIISVSQGQGGSPPSGEQFFERVINRISPSRRLLKSLSIKQGSKYDSLEARDIPTFIGFHELNIDEILDPLDSTEAFNQFFYWKLKPSAHPVETPDDPYRLVSTADCHFMDFESVSEATRL
ncbi:Phosphatidylserine decarboxylase proenzyme 2 [Mycena venus]|uniref:Phosphatidylserine decarboxylase proenzyme 2 n=1 Tax=Mycena venus TaxID=2733690 RepID=A0A8H6Z7G5_9AGAR|nr:Phosphatidylserine decarboxylase proenzyme 2 [Mycena venus]